MLLLLILVGILIILVICFDIVSDNIFKGLVDLIESEGLAHDLNNKLNETSVNDGFINSVRWNSF